jgi:response regulator RpfG family c-di-GMP phosphodiesterase
VSDREMMSPARRLGRSVPGRLGGIEEELASTEFELNHALRVAMRMREPIRQLVSHSTRVLVLVDWLCAELSVGEGEFEHLQYAAQLHEIGMIAVPLRLLQTPGPLTAAELARVRGQATTGAEIIRSYHSPRTAHLVECQYLHHADLALRFPEGSTDLLLAGILRVADVFDTMGNPRPYQRAWTVDERVDELQKGAGSRYHPLVVETFIQAWMSHKTVPRQTL